jgi:hypothetical protein
MVILRGIDSSWTRGIVIPPGITSSWTRNPTGEWYFAGNHQLRDQELIRGMVFSQELFAPGRKIRLKMGIPPGFQLLNNGLD